ncbi:MAG: uroporphyrinogen decarboxylase family protein [Armatimonadetes bacterium]|nr:uroporphyrinogen decarboxylase family protein [Armatimonadota bacterium]
MDFAGYDASTSLAYQLDAIKARAALGDDYIPSLWPGMRAGAVATAFGCEEFVVADQFYVRPIIRSSGDIYHLKKPNLADAGFTRVVLERIRCFRKETRGMLPIHITDMQGPVSLACSLWDDQALMMAMVDQPEAVRFLFDLATEAFIDFVNLQIEAAEGDIVPIHCMPFAWMPPDKGVCVSEDYITLLSAPTYEEFVVPCLERIASAFGGIVVHSCGNFVHSLEMLKGTKGLLGLNFGISETPLPEVINVFGDEVTLLPHASEVSSCCVPVMSQAEHIEYTMELGKRHRLPMQVQVFVDPKSANPDEVLRLDRLASEVSRI